MISSWAETYVGQLYLADISVPPELSTRLGLVVPAIIAHTTIWDFPNNYRYSLLLGAPTVIRTRVSASGGQRSIH